MEKTPVWCAGCAQVEVAPKYGPGYCRGCHERNAPGKARETGMNQGAGGQNHRGRARLQSWKTDLSDREVAREAIKGALAQGELTEDEAIELWLET
jgi:hypothetical protein